MTTFHDVAREVVRRSTRKCARCAGTPFLEYEQQQFDGKSRRVVVRAVCHGERESAEYCFTDHEIKSLFIEEQMDRFVKWLPRRWFLRNWAGYTIRPARQAGRAI